MSGRRIFFGATLLLATFLLPSLLAPVSAADARYIRERRSVVVNGEDESWALVWDAPPSPVCGPDEVFMAITCPCSGWGYGETGPLSLVRSRRGNASERLKLDFLFGRFDYPGETGGLGIVQRWPLVMADMDRELNGDAKLVSEIKSRPSPEVMALEDYDRDGARTEFLLQVGTMPCGKRQFAAVGISKTNSKLHAFGSSSHPDSPIIMPLYAWQALLKSEGPTVVPTWDCGDHGSERRTELVVSATGGAIRVKSRSYSCPEGNEPEQLVEDTNW